MDALQTFSLQQGTGGLRPFPKASAHRLLEQEPHRTLFFQGLCVVVQRSGLVDSPVRLAEHSLYLRWMGHTPMEVTFWRHTLFQQPGLPKKAVVLDHAAVLALCRDLSHLEHIASG